MKKIGWRGALGILLSVALLVWALRGIEFQKVAVVLRDSSVPLLVLSALVATAIYPLRAIRWRYILASVDGKIPFRTLFGATAIGIMVTNVVPARLGELARAYALTREAPQVPFAASFASIAVDRVFDALVIFLLMLLAMLDPAFPGGTFIAGRSVANWAGTGTVALAVGLALLYLVVRFPAPLIRLLEVVTRRVAPRLETRARAALVAFTEGMGVMRHPGHFAAVLFWTVVHWLTNALAFWIGFRAVGIHAPFSSALFIQGIIAIGVAIPSSPGFVGVFESAARVGLAVYAVDATRALSWAIGFHVLSYIPITAIGAWYFTRFGLRLGEVRAAETTANGADAPVPTADGADAARP